MDTQTVFNSDLLYESAKEMFLERGYKNTTFADLASSVGVHRSLVSYYFKNKHNLAETVIQEYFGTYTKAVEKSAEKFGKENDPFCISALRSIVLFNGLNENKNAMRFYLEYINEGGPYPYKPLSRSLFEKMAEKLPDTFDEKQLKFMQMVDNATRESLIKSYFEGLTDLSLDEAIEMHINLVFKMFGLTTQEISRIYKESKNIYDNSKYVFGPGMYIHFVAD